MDSKVVQDTIGNVDLEAICKCLAFAVLKHIDFSKGELLIDDLVDEENDLPQFSYKLGKDLKIDIEEIKQKKEIEKIQMMQKNASNYEELYELMGSDGTYGQDGLFNQQYGYPEGQDYYDEIEEEEYYEGQDPYDPNLQSQFRVLGSQNDGDVGPLPPIIPPN